MLDEPSCAAGGTAVWRRTGVRLRSNPLVAARPHSRQTRVRSSSGISLPPQIGRGQRAGMARSLYAAAITMSLNNCQSAAKTLKQTTAAELQARQRKGRSMCPIC
jgi:hypothetical protein